MTSILSALTVLMLAAVLPAQTQAQVPPPAADTALLVIDIQMFYFDADKIPLVGNLAAAQQARRVLQRFRELKLPLFHIRHMPKPDPKKPAGSGYDFHPEVAPLPGETVVIKHYANSFRETELLDLLRKKNIRKLVITGMQTHMCVEAAVRAAADYGFTVTLVHDACATRNLKFGDSEVPAAQVHTAVLAALSNGYARVISTEQVLGEIK